MFHWICPECGQEIAPGVKECPICEPQAGAPSPTFDKPSAAAAPKVEQRALDPEIVLQPEVVGKVPPRITPQAPPEPETFADRLADLAERLHGERVPYAAPRIIAGTAAPGPHVDLAAERLSIILDVTPARPMLAAPPVVLLLAEPQPPAMAAAIRAQELFRPRPAGNSVPMHPHLGAEPCVPSAIQLPNRPGRSAAPALAPLLAYHKAADRLMRPVVCATRAVAAAAAGAADPKVTLAGPALPRELMSLQAAGLVPIGPARKHAASQNRYAWPTRLAVLAIVLTAGLAATYRVIPGISASTPAKPASEPAPEQTAVARPSNSLARFVEVTGIRFLELNKKPQIHYLVVNHSSAPLNGVTVYVTLRASTSKPGQPPLSRFSFRSPPLAAFEAKEMASPIQSVSGPLDLPDWQDLRADVEVQ